MARKTGLGRGLGAIFGTDVVESVEESLHQPEKKEENHVSRETSSFLLPHLLSPFSQCSRINRNKLFSSTTAP